jgi:uncharacterized membrane protein
VRLSYPTRAAAVKPSGGGHDAKIGGAGNGLNLEHYLRPSTKSSSSSPSHTCANAPSRPARKAKVRVDVVDGLAGELAFRHQGLDAAVMSSVLCTVADVDAALTDLRRVIRPGGELRFYEHVLAHQPRLAALQRALTRSGIWPLIGAGCHADRDTAEGLAMMDMDMMSGMGTMMLIGLELLAIVIAVAVYLGIRAAQTREPREPRQLTARERLQHRLADGEITPDEHVLRTRSRTTRRRTKRAQTALMSVQRPTTSLPGATAWAALEHGDVVYVGDKVRALILE